MNYHAGSRARSGGRLAPKLAVLLGIGSLALASRTSEDPLAELVRDLRSSNKWERKDAVEALARVDSPDAWGHVLEALEDERGEVADTAQFLLSQLYGDRVMLEFFGKRGLAAKEVWVRRRSAEILGRLTIEVPGKRIARFLGDDDAETRRMLLWSLERRAGARRLAPEDISSVLPAVRRAAERDRDPLARARALKTLGLLDPAQAAEAVREALGDRQATVRAAGAMLAPLVLDVEEAAPVALRGLAEDPALFVRLHAVDSLLRCGTPQSARALADALALEQDERAIERVVAALRELSGLDHRRDAVAWSAWAEGLNPLWRPGRGVRTGSDPVPPSEPLPVQATFAGLPIVSRRVAFLIDLSGSIWNERSGGKTRKEIVDGKLREALEDLPPDACFNLVPYTNQPIPWRETLVPATPSNVKRAVAFFEELAATGSGNFWDAALLALGDPEVDTLVVLTDGVPTGGRHTRLELIVPLFVELTEWRRVAVDSVLVDAPRREELAWQELAEQTGGRSLSIRLE